jgi:hypothetical protein
VIVPVLPSEPFELVCEAAGQYAPSFARSQFRIRVDPEKGIYAFDHWENYSPIHRIDRNQLIFCDETIAKGADNNPEFWHISYDLPSGLLTYQASWSGRMPISHKFKTQCRIA